MGTYARLEAQILFTGVQTITVSGAAIGVANIGVGPWYPSDLLTEVDNQLTTATGVAWTVTGNFSDADSGLVVIDLTPAGNCVLTWTTSDIRDVLGFSGAATASAGIHTGTRCMSGVWLPDCAYSGETFDPQLDGHRVSNARTSTSPSGEVYGLGGRTYKRQKNINWNAVSRNRFIEGADATAYPWATWLNETQWGGKSYFQPFSKFRFYSDAKNNVLMGTYRMTGKDKADDTKLKPQWNGRWRVTLPQIVVTT